MILKWYDASGAVIQTDSQAWNVNDAKAGTTYRAKGTSFIDTGTPVKVQVFLFDYQVE